MKRRSIGRSLHWLTALSILATVPSLSRADTLVFKNGDRLSGTALAFNPGEIHFEADVLGAIVVDADEAVVLSTTSADSQTNTTGDSRKAPEQRGIEAAALRTVSESTSSKEHPRSSSWSRQLELGLTEQSGRRDQRDVMVRLDLAQSTDAGELRLQGRYLYGRSDDVRSTDKLGGALRVRRGLTSDLFAQLETRYQRDSISQIDHDAEQSLGVGTSLVRREGLSLSVGGGAAARFRASTVTDGGWSYLVDAFQELKYAVSRQVTLSQNLSVVMSPFQDEVFAVKLNAALSSALTETIKLVMRYEFEYDQSLVRDARENQRLVTSFGYLF